MCLQGALGSCGQRMTASLKFSQRSLCCATGLSGNVQKYTQKNGPPISACTVHVTSCSLWGEMREMLAVTYDPTTEFMYWTCLDRLVTAGVEAGVPDSHGGLTARITRKSCLRKVAFTTLMRSSSTGTECGNRKKATKPDVRRQSGTGRRTYCLVLWGCDHCVGAKPPPCWPVAYPFAQETSDAVQPGKPHIWNWAMVSAYSYSPR